MSAASQSQKKSIAKNTAFLYVRMLVVMVVSFYTSRVVLHALGETDYGIYDVVGGIVMMMTFINGSLAASTSRFLTYELGRKDFRQLARTFSAALNLHIGVSVQLHDHTARQAHRRFLDSSVLTGDHLLHIHPGSV